MLKIGEFSKMAKTTVKTLRFYDEVGLFKPTFVDSNGYRYYDIDQLNTLQTIVELRSYDLPIESIKNVLEGADVKGIISAHILNLESQSARLKSNIKLLKNYLDAVQKGEKMNNYQANIITVPGYIVYKKHGIIPTMANLFDFVLSAGAEASKNNPTLECIDYCYITYSAQEYKETDVELEYVEAVKTCGKASEHIEFGQIPPIKAISVQHKGPYSELQKAYAFALNFTKEHNFQIAGPIREVYIDGCWNKESEADYLTEIQIPIETLK